MVELRGTPELRFSALLADGGVKRLDLMRAK